MKFQALLVSHDDSAAEVLSRILVDFEVELERCVDLDAVSQLLDEKRFDAAIVDVDDSQTAAHVLQALRQSSTSRNAISVGLVGDPANVRSAFGVGANFVLYKPVSDQQAHASFRAATALLKRERRRTFRVPVQLPVTLSWEGASEVEGIVLDLSEDGMDVLSAQPLQSSQKIEFCFALPDSTQIQSAGQVAWANSNGQSGLQFAELPADQYQILCRWLSANAPEAPPEDEPLSQGKLSDLSLGGCYVETESPFPRQTRIDLCLQASDLEVHVEGVVRVMHPSFGMGVEFASRTGEQRRQVEQFIDFLTSQPGVMPQLLVSPKSISFQTESISGSDQDDPEDALLQLLRNEDGMSQEEFLAELRRQRRSEAEASMA
jgi:DNA-binding response OmpR family regulator